MTSAELLLFRAWANHTFPSQSLPPETRVIQAAAFLEGFRAGANLTGSQRKEANLLTSHINNSEAIDVIIKRMCNISGLKQLPDEEYQQTQW